jgi:predicted O-methyltransferase YrrM
VIRLDQKYLSNINVKETNEILVSLSTFASENNVPIITKEGIRFLNQIISISKSKRILEIGTAIGYSSINMALNNNVEIVTIERNEEMYSIANENIKIAGLDSKIKIIHIDALEVDELKLGKFDLIFIDAAKAQSIKFFEKFKSLLNSKGIIVTDNLLFHGLVYGEVKERNLKQLVRKIDTFNKFIVTQEDFDTHIYAIGDGMSLSVKRK